MKTPHFLDISESEYPAEYREVIRRLIKAASEPQVRRTMDVEDEIIEELGGLERIIAVRDKTINDQKRELDDQRRELDDQKKLIEELKQQLGKK
ncbi:MAG: hypothetical protein Q3M24_01475 [Candidatus Electrothrix aestuarii]|uniref:Uncharacterized protein n=1 Tax=Candidatus Electrothrix aestuarii TaxID=3062594 RepID=A0AAU8LVZ7_9BACT